MRKRGWAEKSDEVENEYGEEGGHDDNNEDDDNKY